MLSIFGNIHSSGCYASDSRAILPFLFSNDNADPPAEVKVKVTHMSKARKEGTPDTSRTTVPVDKFCVVNCHLNLRLMRFNQTDESVILLRDVSDTHVLSIA